MKSIPAAFTDRLKKLRGDERTEDFTITCEGSEWKVHSQLLLFHSDVFGKAVSGAFKVCAPPPGNIVSALICTVGVEG